LAALTEFNTLLLKNVDAKALQLLAGPSNAA
jgi:hypothetical protein